jgi:hypothetical protein
VTNVYALGSFRLDMRCDLLLRGTEPVALGLRAIALFACWSSGPANWSRKTH